LFNATDGSLIRTFSGQNNDVYCISISPDGSMLAAGEGGFDASGESFIIIWDINTGQLITTLQGHEYWVDAVSFSSDGNYLLSSGRDGAPPNNNPKIKLWKTSDWSLQTYYDEGLGYSTIVAAVPGQNLFIYGNSYGELHLAELPAVTPVELSSFRASVKNGNVILNWLTETETNNKGFEIQRSELGNQEKAWEKIWFIEGNGTTTRPHSYSFIDNDITSAAYVYRLKQTDLDGTYHYSNLVEVEVKNQIQFSLKQNYPNPSNPSTKIDYQIPTDGFVNITVYNLLGEKIRTIVNEFKREGNYQVNFDGSALPSGVYIYRIQSGEFSFARKMILAK
jgi:Secretion system C-terminal sorting domain/WD domain, G-beta repeat